MGNTPFMTVNSFTGETVSLPYPALLGNRVYSGSSGAVYGVAVSRSAGNVQTSIIWLDISNPAQTRKIAEYNGEEPSFTMAESGGNLAASPGGSAAVIFRNSPASPGRTVPPPEIIPMERSIGLPVKISDGHSWFIVLDGEGCIVWHDNRTGKVLAVFRLFPDRWVLIKDEETISGPVSAVRN